MSVQNIAATVSNSLVERDGEINAIMLGLVSREHVLLVGPPGVGKSYVCRSVCDAISGVVYVERLLSPTTDPNDVFGPIDPVEYRTTGRYVRRTEGYAAAAHLLFLDEFFRASDSIRDTLLHLLGPERQVLVDGQQIRTPLLCGIGATNSFADSGSQGAILDRWLIRKVVKPVSRNGREQLMFGAMPPVVPMATLAELIDAGNQAAALPMSADAKAAAVRIMEQLSEEGIKPSDRRARAAMKVVRASAYLAGNNQVEVTDLECLVDVLWDQPDQREKATDVILKIANPSGARLNELLLEVDQIVSNAGTELTGRMEALKKLSSSLKEVDKLVGEHVPRADQVKQFIQRESQRMQALALGMGEDQVNALLSMQTK